MCVGSTSSFSEFSVGKITRYSQGCVLKTFVIDYVILDFRIVLIRNSTITIILFFLTKYQGVFSVCFLCESLVGKF